MYCQYCDGYIAQDERWHMANYHACDLRMPNHDKYYLIGGEGTLVIKCSCGAFYPLPENLIVMKCS